MQLVEDRLDRCFGHEPPQALAPPKRATCLINELEMCEYSPSAMRKTVSISGSSRWFVTSCRTRTPCPSVCAGRAGSPRAPIRRTYCTVTRRNGPPNVGVGLNHRRGQAVRSSTLNSDSFIGLTPATATVIEEHPAAANHVKMAKRDRIERAGEHRGAERVSGAHGHGQPRANELRFLAWVQDAGEDGRPVKPLIAAIVIVDMRAIRSFPTGTYRDILLPEHASRLLGRHVVVLDGDDSDQSSGRIPTSDPPTVCSASSGTALARF